MAKVEKVKAPIIPEDDSFLEIDKLALDEEWVNQAPLFHKFSRKLARCVEKVEETKNNRELVAAQLGTQMRENPENFGLSKTTDAAVKDAVIQHPLYQNAIGAEIKAEYNKSLLMGTVRALDQRKEGLENLVKLHGANYYADPVAENEDDRDKMRDFEKRKVRSRGRSNSD